MKILAKRGLSPVVATVMLVVLAIVLVGIILLWAKSWVGEKIQKDLGGGVEAVESFCDDVDFIAEIETSGKVSVSNSGNVPLYGMEIRKKGAGFEESLGSVDFENGLPKGSSKTSSDGVEGVNPGDELTAIPILLGETESYKKPYTCENAGKPAEVV